MRPEVEQTQAWEGGCEKGSHLTPRAKPRWGSSLAGQWLGLGAFTAGTQVQSLVRELRSCKMCSVAKKEKKKKKDLEDKEIRQQLPHPHKYGEQGNLPGGPPRWNLTGRR